MRAREHKNGRISAEAVWHALVTELVDSRASNQPSAPMPGAAPGLLDASVDLAGAVGDLVADRVGEAACGVHVHDDGSVAFEADF